MGSQCSRSAAVETKAVDVRVSRTDFGSSESVTSPSELPSQLSVYESATSLVDLKLQPSFSEHDAAAATKLQSFTRGAQARKLSQITAGVRVSKVMNTMETDSEVIVEVLNDTSLRHEQRLSIAMMLGYSEESVELTRWQTAIREVSLRRRALQMLSAASKSVSSGLGADEPEEAKPKYNDAFIGKCRRLAQCLEASPRSADARLLRLCASGIWEQESMESSKLEAILKKQGFPWVVRSIALSTKLNMAFSVDGDGDLLYSSRVPVQGEQRVRASGPSSQLTHATTPPGHASKAEDGLLCTGQMHRRRDARDQDAWDSNEDEGVLEGRCHRDEPGDDERKQDHHRDHHATLQRRDGPDCLRE